MSGRHRRPDPPRRPAAPLILAAGWLALVGAPATYGAAQYDPGTPPTVLTQPQPRVAAVTPRVPPLIGAVGLQPNAVALAAYIQATYPSVLSIGGVRPCDGYNEHCRGVALDIMIGSDIQLGNRIDADLLAQASRFQIKFTMWQHREQKPSGAVYWIAERGSATADHEDHLHVSVAAG